MGVWVWMKMLIDKFMVESVMVWMIEDGVMGIEYVESEYVYVSMRVE